MSKFPDDTGVQDIAAAIKAKADAAYAASSHKHEQADIKYGGLNWYGTSDTTESTATKVVTCSHFADSHNNVFIAVKFSAANTQAVQINLDVNSIGARVVQVNGSATSSSNPLTWAADDVLMFMFMTGTYVYLGGSSTMGGSGGGSRSSFYGTCSTTASTAAKVVTCADWALEAGNTISILATTANTAATPTLDVNSTGSKSIYVGSANPSSTGNVLKWSANTLLTFVYDGSYYRFISAIAAASTNQPLGAATWYGTSNTGATTQAKTSDITNFRLTVGAVVSVRFTSANTHTSPTLNISSTGAKSIRYGQYVVSSTNKLLWSAYDTLTFMYDGTYWQVIAISPPKKASVTQYLTSGTLIADVDGTSIYAPSGGGGGGMWTDVTQDFYDEDSSWYNINTLEVCTDGHTLYMCGEYTAGDGTDYLIPQSYIPDGQSFVVAAVSDTAQGFAPLVYTPKADWIFNDMGYLGMFSMTWPVSAS